MIVFNSSVTVARCPLLTASLPLGLSPRWLQALPGGRSPFHPHTPRPSSLMHRRKEGQLGTILAPVGTRGEEPPGGVRGTFPGWPLARPSGTHPLLEGTPGSVLVFVGLGCREGPRSHWVPGRAAPLLGLHTVCALAGSWCVPPGHCQAWAGLGLPSEAQCQGPRAMPFAWPALMGFTSRWDQRPGTWR